MILSHSSYRSLLRALLAERVERNPQYSLRAMARAISIPAPVLSGVLNGKRNLSLARAHQLAEKLEFSEKEKEYFSALVQFENAKTPSLKEAFERRLRELAGGSGRIYDLTIDHFSSIAKWYHLALLQLFDTEKTVDAKTTARRLGISVHEAQDALDRLERLDLVERSEDSYRRLQYRLLVSSQMPNEAIRSYQRVMLNQAAESLETQTNDEKFVGSETFAFDPAMLPAARDLIEDCFRKLLELAARSDKRTEVYHAGVNFFRVTKNSNKKEKRK